MRAKVTGVTVAVLAIGLFSAGVGAVPFLHSAFIQQIDDSLKQQASTTTPQQVFTISEVDGQLIFTPRSTIPGTMPFTAIYVSDQLVAMAGGYGHEEPQIPSTLRLDIGPQRDSASDLSSVEGREGAFRARVELTTVSTSQGDVLVSQLVAIPTADVDRSIATYLGIFGILATVTIIAVGMLTRWLVTLTFRSLGQVEATAMAIASGNFSQRMAGAEPRTEVGRLKTAINTMLGRMDAALAQRDASVRQMRRFVGDASHELRTPLVTVRGYAELYRMGAIRGEEDTAQAMDRIEKEAIRMAALVEDLLALARLDEKRPLTFAAIDLRPIARDAAMDLRAQAPDRPVTVFTERQTPTTPIPVQSDAATGTTTHARKGRAQATAALSLAEATLQRLRRKPRPVTGPGQVQPLIEEAILPPPARDPIVLGAEDKIRQVVANIVGNARRYTPEGSPIDFAVGVDDTETMGWIAIIDHGEGIPDQMKSQIFQRFWRADTSRTRETGGSGLGLAIVASIVEAHHGNITVEDTPGGGATFRISFPLASRPEAAEHLHIETQPLQRLTEADIAEMSAEAKKDNE